MYFAFLALFQIRLHGSLHFVLHICMTIQYVTTQHQTDRRLLILKLEMCNCLSVRLSVRLSKFVCCKDIYGAHSEF